MFMLRLQLSNIDSKNVISVTVVFMLNSAIHLHSDAGDAKSKQLKVSSW